MKSFLKSLVYAVISMAVIVGAVYLWGAHMPEAHFSSRVVYLSTSQGKVWQMLTHYEAMPTWSRDIKAIQPLPNEDGKRCYSEVRSYLSIPFCETTSQAPRKLILSTIGSDTAYQGKWTFTLLPLSPQETQLVLAEEGSVPNPIYRYVNYQVGIEAAIRSFEEDLARTAAK